MVKRIESLSVEDVALIRKQLWAAYCLIAGFAFMGCIVVYFMFDRSWLAVLEGAVVAVGIFLVAKYRISQKINPILEDNRKLVFFNATITNKDIETEWIRRMDRETSSINHYVVYLGEERIEVGLKNYELYEIGMNVTIEVTNVSSFFLKIEKV